MTIPILSLIITLLAVIVGPFVSYKIAKKNLEFQFRKMTQGQWIDKLEQTAIEFLDSNVQWVEKYEALKMRGEQHTESLTEVNNKIDKMLDSINSTIVKLDLLLDEEKPLQKKIIDDCVEMKSIILKTPLNEKQLSSLRELHKGIVFNLKKVFKEERKKIASVVKTNL